MAPLTRDHVYEIITNSLRHYIGGIKSQLDEVRVEIKVLRGEVKSMSHEIVDIKRRLTYLET